MTAKPASDLFATFERIAAAATRQTAAQMQIEVSDAAVEAITEELAFAVDENDKHMAGTTIEEYWLHGEMQPHPAAPAQEEGPQ